MLFLCEWFILDFFLLKPDVNMQHLIDSISERILLLSWWTFAIAINSLYTSVLVSLLLIVKFGPEIESVEQLAYLSSYSLCLQAGGYQTDYFFVHFWKKLDYIFVDFSLELFFLFKQSNNKNYKTIYSYIQENQNKMKGLTLATEIFDASLQGSCFGFVDHMVKKIFANNFFWVKRFHTHFYHFFKVRL